MTSREPTKVHGLLKDMALEHLKTNAQSDVKSVVLTVVDDDPGVACRFVLENFFGELGVVLGISEVERIDHGVMDGLRNPFDYRIMVLSITGNDTGVRLRLSRNLLLLSTKNIHLLGEGAANNYLGFELRRVGGLYFKKITPRQALVELTR